eukprot:g8736.t1
MARLMTYTGLSAALWPLIASGSIGKGLLDMLSCKGPKTSDDAASSCAGEAVRDMLYGISEVEVTKYLWKYLPKASEQRVWLPTLFPCGLKLMQMSVEKGQVTCSVEESPHGSLMDVEDGSCQNRKFAVEQKQQVEANASGGLVEDTQDLDPEIVFDATPANSGSQDGPKKFSEAWFLELLCLSRIPAKYLTGGGILKTNDAVSVDKPWLLESEAAEGKKTGPLRENAWFEISLGTTKSEDATAGGTATRDEGEKVVDTVLFSFKEMYDKMPKITGSWRNSGPGSGPADLTIAVAPQPRVGMIKVGSAS